MSNPKQKQFILCTYFLEKISMQNILFISDNAIVNCTFISHNSEPKT